MIQQQSVCGLIWNGITSSCFNIPRTLSATINERWHMQIPICIITSLQIWFQTIIERDSLHHNVTKLNVSRHLLWLCHVKMYKIFWRSVYRMFLNLTVIVGVLKITFFLYHHCMFMRVKQWFWLQSHANLF